MGWHHFTHKVGHAFRKAGRKIDHAVRKSAGPILSVATGGLVNYGRQKSQDDAYKEEQRRIEEERKKQEADMKRQQEMQDQTLNKNRQESSDLGALNQDRNSDIEGGMLTDEDEDGLVISKPLSKKKKLGA